MADLTSAATGAGGVGTRAARWGLVLLWASGVWLGTIEGYLPPGEPTGTAVYALALLAALVLTSPAPAPLTHGRSTGVVLVAMLAASATLSRATGVTELWPLDFASYLVALLVSRGNVVAGAWGALGVLGSALAWVWPLDPTITELGLLLGIPVASVVAGIAWRVHLRHVVRQEHWHRASASRSAEEIGSSLEVIEATRRELAEIGRQAAPVLTRLSRGDEVDDDLRAEAARVEATLRDRIRGSHLNHPDLVRSVEELRSRGVTVVLLGEPVERHLDDGPLLSTLVELLGAVREGDVTVRSLPADRAAAVSVVVRSGHATEHVTVGTDGAVLSRF